MVEQIINHNLIIGRRRLLPHGKDLPPMPKLILDYLETKKDRECSMYELIRAGNIYKVPVQQITDSDRHLIRARINAGRDYLSNLPNGDFRKDLYIYEFYGYGSYILTKKMPMGSKFHAPIKYNDAFNELTTAEWKFLTECEVGVDGRVLRKLSVTELQIFSLLCLNYSKISRPKVTTYDEIFNDLGKENNDKNKATLRSQIRSMRKVIKESGMEVKTVSGIGYMFGRQKTISS